LQRPLSDPRTRASSIDKLLLTLILVLAGAATVLGVTGGVDLRAIGIPFSSRDPVRPAIVAFVLAVILVTRHRVLVGAWLSWFGTGCAKVTVKIAPAVAVALSLSVSLLALKFGTHVTGGADVYGYVSQAWLWANGGPTIEQPFAREMPLPHVDELFAPLGYRPALGGGGIVPTYAPGLPLLMALLIFPFGECGPYLVVPLLAGVLVWVTYKIGERVTASRPLGLAGAALMASSPAFLFMSTLPMSDVPVAALFCSAVLAALTPMRARAFVTGLLVGLSVLVRPNLAPMAAIFAAYLAWSDGNWRERMVTLLAFGAGCLPAAVAVAIIHTHLYGAPWKSGYGDFSTLYAWSFFWTNLRQFVTWFAQTQTPAALLFAAVPFLAIWKLPAEQRPLVVFLGAFAAGIWGCYIFYVPFGDWWYLRFILSSFAPLLVLAVFGWYLSLRWMGRALSAIVLIGLVASVAGYQIGRLPDLAVLAQKEGESYTIGRYVRRVLPKNAVLLSMQHSGSLRMYGERLTLRYDWIDPASYQRVLETLVAKGYRPYLVLSQFEEAEFRRQFSLPQTPGDSAPGVLMAEVTHPSTVRLYDPLRETPVDTPRVIPPLMQRPCRF
jgi:hypothetical protein